MKANFNSIELAVIGATVIFFLLCGCVLLFIILYKRKQLKNQSEKELMTKNFDMQILSAQLEISEQTLKEISQELHDNIGQRLTLAILETRKELGEGHGLDELLNDTLEDIRDISKSMNGNYVEQVGLDLAIEHDCKRLTQASALQCTYHPTDQFLGLTVQQEIILYRCFQELVNNSLKHSKASEISVSLSRVSDQALLLISDNGKGFNPKEAAEGIGLLNLAHRVEMLNGDLNMSSDKGSDTKTEISIPILINKQP